jgi:hypothetical protein
MRNIGFIFVMLALAGCAQIPSGIEKNLQQMQTLPSVCLSKTSVSQQEVQWALGLEEKISDEKYQPTPQELAQYQDIAKRLSDKTNNCKINNSQNQENTQSELRTEPKIIDEEYKSNTQDIKEDQNSDNDLSNDTPNCHSTDTPSQKEIQWALELEKKVKEENYRPNP